MKLHRRFYLYGVESIEASYFEHKGKENFPFHIKWKGSKYPDYYIENGKV